MALTLDGKGRIAIPTRYHPALKEQAQGRLVLTRHPDGCLMLFTAADWADFSGLIAALPMEAEWWKRAILGFMHEAEMDSTNRVLIPPILRKAAGLTKDVIMMGMGRYFELWDEERHEARLMQGTQGDKPAPLKNLSFF